jgi:chromate transporter
MSDDVVPQPSATVATPALASGRVEPTVAGLFFGFLKVTLTGFGGILPWARREFVNVRRWMTQDEFNELFSLCQFLPGPNIVNFALVYGYRLHGVAGAAAGTTGLLVPPVILIMCAGALYGRYGELPAFHGGLTGLAAAAAGLLISSAVQMAEPLFRRRLYPAILLVTATFVAAGVLQLPLLWVIAVLVPISITVAWKTVT